MNMIIEDWNVEAFDDYQPEEIIEPSVEFAGLIEPELQAAKFVVHRLPGRFHSCPGFYCEFLPCSSTVDANCCCRSVARL